MFVWSPSSPSQSPSVLHHHSWESRGWKCQTERKTSVEQREHLQQVKQHQWLEVWSIRCSYFDSVSEFNSAFAESEINANSWHQSRFISALMYVLWSSAHDCYSFVVFTRPFVFLCTRPAWYDPAFIMLASGLLMHYYVDVTTSVLVFKPHKTLV